MSFESIASTGERFGNHTHHLHDSSYHHSTVQDSRDPTYAYSSTRRVRSAIRYKRIYNEYPSTRNPVQDVTRVIQATQSGGVQPYGVSQVIAGCVRRWCASGARERERKHQLLGYEGVGGAQWPRFRKLGLQKIDHCRTEGSANLLSSDTRVKPAILSSLLSSITVRACYTVQRTKTT